MQLTEEFLSVFAQKEAKRYKVKVGVLLFLIQDNNVLLLRRFQTGIDDGVYVIPMGGHDGKAPLTTTMIREAEEETNIILKHEDVRVCHVMHRFHPMPQGLSFEQIDVYFQAHTFKGVIENREPHKCDDLRFYPVDRLPANTAPFIRHALECTLQGQFFSEFGWN